MTDLIFRGLVVGCTVMTENRSPVHPKSRRLGRVPVVSLPSDRRVWTVEVDLLSHGSGVGIRIRQVVPAEKDWASVRQNGPSPATVRDGDMRGE